MPNTPEDRSALTASDAFEERLGQFLQSGRMAEACNLIVSTLGPELRGYLRGIMASDCDGDDLFQELCTAIWERLPGFERRSTARTWAYAIAHNQVRTKLARFSRRHVVRLDTDAGQHMAAPSMDAPDEQVRRQEAVLWLQQQLSPAERELLILRTERDFSFQQISQILETTEASAKQRFYRLTLRLKELRAQVEQVGRAS